MIKEFSKELFSSNRLKSYLWRSAMAGVAYGLTILAIQIQAWPATGDASVALFTAIALGLGELSKGISNYLKKEEEEGAGGGIA